MGVYRTSLAATFLCCALGMGCAQQSPGTPPSSDRFYFPTGIAFAPDAAGGPGFLYVVSSNFDLRFNRGTLASVDLSTLNLPASAGAAPVQIAAAPITTQVTIDSFGGPLAITRLPGQTGNARRLFVAGRFSNVLQAIDAEGPLLRCVSKEGRSTSDCLSTALSLSLGDSNQLRDAYRPVVAGGVVFLGHISVVDVPKGSGLQRHAFLGEVDAQQPFRVGLLPVGVEPVDGLAQAGGFLYLGGRASGSDGSGTPLRRVQLSQLGTTLTTVAIRSGADVVDTRGMALSSDGTRLYLATRSPDGLVVIDVSPGANGMPDEQVVGVVELPKGAGEVAVIPRGAGRRDLVAVTCSDDGSVALYDDEIGRVVATVRGAGDQPFGVAVGPRPGSGVRLYVTAFGRGSLGVIDLPDLDDAQSAAVLAVIGPNENCLNDNPDARPPECPK